MILSKLFDMRTFACPPMLSDVTGLKFLGIEWSNPDLRENYNSAGSWDLLHNKADPAPDPRKGDNHHGTRCAGEIAAVANRCMHVNRACPQDRALRLFCL